MGDKIPTQLLKAARQRIAETGRLLLVYSAAPWGAGGGGQRPEQLAEQLARHACVVHLGWSNPNKIRRDGSVIVRSTREITAWEQVPAPHKVAYVGMPDVHGWPMALRLGERPDWHIWYDCIDDWGNFSLGHLGTEIRRNEADVIARASLLTATAKSLVAHVQEYKPSVPVRLLVNSTRLAGRAWPDPCERTVDCVFVGHLDPTWINWSLIRRIADRHTVRMIGAPMHQGPQNTRVYPFHHENVEWCGQVPNDNLMPLLATARVGIAPFANIPLCTAVWPIKYADYLAAGLPTIASYLPELQGHQYARVAMDDCVFLIKLQKALAERWDRQAIAAHAHEHTAAARAQQAHAWMQEAGIW